MGLIQTIATWLIGGLIGLMVIAAIWKQVKEAWLGKPPEVPPQY